MQLSVLVLLFKLFSVVIFPMETGSASKCRRRGGFCAGGYVCPMLRRRIGSCSRGVSCCEM
uniref:Beta-defensin-like domain-containing protein n=1 Tax=Catharus ustulatus TaxID=91951 RepID=A0A8C3U788_CATUS